MLSASTLGDRHPEAAIKSYPHGPLNRSVPECDLSRTGAAVAAARSAEPSWYHTAHAPPCFAGAGLAPGPPRSASWRTFLGSKTCNGRDRRFAGGEVKGAVQSGSLKARLLQRAGQRRLQGCPHVSAGSLGQPCAPLPPTTTSSRPMTASSSGRGGTSGSRAPAILQLDGPQVHEAQARQRQQRREGLLGLEPEAAAAGPGHEQGRLWGDG